MKVSQLLLVCVRTRKHHIYLKSNTVRLCGLQPHTHGARNPKAVVVDMGSSNIMLFS